MQPTDEEPQKVIGTLQNIATTAVRDAIHLAAVVQELIDAKTKIEELKATVRKLEIDLRSTKGDR